MNTHNNDLKIRCALLFLVVFEVNDVEILSTFDVGFNTYRIQANLATVIST